MIKLIGIFSAFFLTACTQEELSNPFELAKNSLIIDTHIDAPHKLNLLNKQGKQIHNLADFTETQFDYPKAISGGLNIAFMSIYLPSETQINGTSFQEANQLIDLMEDVVTLNPEKFILIKATENLDSLINSRRIGLALGMENGAPIGGILERVKFFYDRGIRYITLTHSKANHISDSSYDPIHLWNGLSSFGKELIIEMNKVGIMVDISHVSDEAFFQAIEISEVPVIASHSSLRYFTPDFERNMSDAMLIKLAEKGGVVQINFGSTFISGKARNYSNEMKAYLIEELGEGFLSYSIEDQNEVREKFVELKGPLPFAEVSDVLDHIDRAIKLVGVDHVGLGSDFDGVGDSLPVGLKDVSMYPNLIQGMLDRGYLEKDIKKILGGNIRRVWRSAEEYAKNAG